jgi:transposase-like protein
MKRYRRAAREEMVMQYQNSGLSAWQFCQQYGVTETSLGRWIKEFRRVEAETAEPGISLVEIQNFKPGPLQQSETRNSSVTIRFPNGMVVEIGHGTDVSWISHVLDLVGRIA